MNLFDKVSEDIKDAMRAKDKVRLEALRGAKKEFIEAKTSKEGHGELEDDTAIKILQKMVKQRKDSAEIYVSQSRQDLAEKELAEVAVLEGYLPKQLTAEELEAKLKAIITQVGASGPADMGKVMGVATKELAGLAAGRAISETVKKLLS
ncbi:MAG: GatB/YqeY domain-containing protein [Dysgonomonas sp.]|uniref:GatB/YqeY domain-containing protein n=1 Tax=Dysgonomonas sp. TaxID=1891233 RepID=UPI0039E54A57